MTPINRIRLLPNLANNYLKGDIRAFRGLNIESQWEDLIRSENFNRAFSSYVDLPVIGAVH